MDMMVGGLDDGEDHRGHDDHEGGPSVNCIPTMVKGTYLPTRPRIKMTTNKPGTNSTFPKTTFFPTGPQSQHIRLLTRTIGPTASSTKSSSPSPTPTKSPGCSRASRPQTATCRSPSCSRVVSARASSPVRMCTGIRLVCWCRWVCWIQGLCPRGLRRRWRRGVGARVGLGLSGCRLAGGRRCRLFWMCSLVHIKCIY